MKMLFKPTKTGPKNLVLQLAAKEHKETARKKISFIGWQEPHGTMGSQKGETVAFHPRMDLVAWWVRQPVSLSIYRILKVDYFTQVKHNHKTCRSERSH
jgi:hypothetical protein